MKYHPDYESLKFAISNHEDFVEVITSFFDPNKIRCFDQVIEFIPFKQERDFGSQRFLPIKTGLVGLVQGAINIDPDEHEKGILNVLNAFKKSEFSSEELMLPNGDGETLLHTAALMEHPKIMCAVINAGVGVRDLLMGAGAVALEIASPQCRDRLNEYRAFGKISLVIVDVITEGNAALMQSPAEKERLTDIIFHDFVKCYNTNIIDAKEALRLDGTDLNFCTEAVIKANPYIQLVSQKIAQDLFVDQEMSSSSSSAAVEAAIPKMNKEKILEKIFQTRYCRDISAIDHSEISQSSSSSTAAGAPSSSAIFASAGALQIDELKPGNPAFFRE